MYVAWSCDGKKLAATVGIDKITRVWSPEKSVSVLFSVRLWAYGLLDGIPLCDFFLR